MTCTKFVLLDLIQVETVDSESELYVAHSTLVPRYMESAPPFYWLPSNKDDEKHFTSRVAHGSRNCCKFIAGMRL